MTTPFEAVLVTTHLKHLLVSSLTRRTACNKVMRSGKIHDGLKQWLNGYAPVHCRGCAEEWEKEQQ